VSSTGPSLNPSLSILYIGSSDGTSLDRAHALRRLGHQVEHVNPRELLPETLWIDRVIWRLGGHLLSPLLLRELPKALRNDRYDLCYVDGGDCISPSVVRLIQPRVSKIINYNIDDPLGVRDIARFAAYRRSVSLYDLCVVVRSENVVEAKRLGAKDVVRVFRSSDEIAHAPRTISADDAKRWHADVLFLGTWFPERGPFLLKLIELGVPLAIRGANWQKAREWSALKAYYKGGQLYGDDYARALQCARVNLGLLSKGNRDLHTTRSLEIPALGALLCAERTTEHLEMYDEGEEALFWDSAEECAAACFSVLRDEVRRRKIAAAGHARSIVNGHHNEKVLRAVLERAFSGH
jgi:spore maturation protein CgeB